MSDDGSSSDEEVQRELSLKHSIELRLDLDTPAKAQIVCEALSVDKEPKRSNAVRELRQDGQFLLITVRSEDRRSLQKSTANLLDMCDLSMSTLDMAIGRKWLIEPPKKKEKADKNPDRPPTVKKLKLENSQA
ncbi:hypothetical protein PFISCL1PPCAC_10899 [Pristionchus fissidentatus]|uniref:L antigen family member 3 n=1 Tax=Pristionchus fissidentatus TaxID=1538716 RepID=A0AAV5VNI9_9BILA|nr:hypothetical protein PFISCL1PPCAC_10899 [Pristionchus fissidentatus]